MAQIEIKDFTGGLNENYNSARPNQYAKADNVLLNREGNPITRPGSDLFDVSNPQLPTGNQRVGTIINYAKDTAMFCQSGTRLFQYNAGWQETFGPTGGVAFPSLTTNGKLSFAEWKKHLLISSDEQISPIKIYKDQGGSFKSVTAGLPIPANNANFNATTELANAITLANDLRTKLLAHFSDTIIHVIADTVSPALLTAPAATDLTTLLALTSSLMASYDNHYRDSASLLASSTNSTVSKFHKYPFPGMSAADVTPKIYPYSPSLNTKSAPATLQEAASRLNDLRKNYNFHDGDMDVHIDQLNPPGNHLITTARMSPLTFGPSIVPDYQPLYDLANQIKAKFLAHMADGMTAYTGITSTAGSPILTGFTSTASINVGDYIYGIQMTSGPTTVVSKTGTTVTALVNFTNTITGKFGIGPGTRAHSYPDTFSTAIVTAPDATSLITLRDLLFQLRLAYSKHYGLDPYIHILTTIPSGEKLLDGTSLNNFSVVGIDKYDGFNSDMISGMIAALNELKVAYDLHDADNGLHYFDNSFASNYQVASTPLVLSSYAWAFVYSHTYTTSDGVEFKTIGTPIFKQVADASTTNPLDADQGQVITIDQKYPTITGIPVLANSGSLNYDTSNIIVEIYRTIDGGTSFFKTGQVTNGTTTYTDRTLDSDLITQEELYSDSGESDHDAPPQAKFVHIIKDTAYYGNLKFPDGSTYPNRIQQAIPGTLDACPGDFFVDLPYENVGISSFRGIPIAWTKNGQYRIEGTFDVLGRGSIRAVGITDSVGMEASFSPVQTDGGIVFAGSDGFYITDGYKQSKLSRDWVTTYLNLVSTSSKSSAIHGTLDRKRQRVWWVTNQGSSDNDSCQVLDLNFSLAENAVFTSVSGGTSFAPTAIGYFNGQIIRGDSRGYVFYHAHSLTNDPKVDTSTSVTNWGKNSIIYTLTSAAFDFGSQQVRKWVSLIYGRFKNLGNLSAQINGINDDGVTHSCTAIRSRGATALIQEKRHFPSGYMRCTSKQIQVTNAFVIIVSSSTLGNATVNKAAKTVAITGIWPAYLNDQVITFANDNYTRQFTILSQSGATLTVSDPGGNLPASGSYAFQVKGYPKDELLQLLSLTVEYSMMGEEQKSAVTESGTSS